MHSATAVRSCGRKVRIVLQARTTSSRQPAKSLLPLGGLPLAILCAKRLKRGGMDVLLATSEDQSDDILSAIAAREGVAIFRGDLTDVLSRFIGAVADLSNDDVVVRMTADNPVPDADFVARLVEIFRRRGVSYLASRWPEDGLPYGVGGEVFTVAALRRATHAVAAYEREHVTPFLAAHEDVGVLLGNDLALDRDCSNLRCTIDTLDDYLAMARVFDLVADPVMADWRSLVQLLPSVPRQTTPAIPNVMRNGESLGRIVLGTAQFGMTYGVTNRTGCPSDDEFRAILRFATSAGVTHIDTARGYGTAETRLGGELVAVDLAGVHIITKLASLSMLHGKADASVVAEAVDASVFRSCHALQRRRIDVVLIHRFKDVILWNGAALDRLSALVDEGIVGAIGASVYTPAEAIRCLADERIQHIQIPFNLLDARWLSEDFQTALRERPAVTVHARSVFLQGLLINSARVWPEWFRRADSVVGTIAQLCAALDRRSAADLCMAYVSAFPWISTMVLGVERLEQIEELVALASAPPLSAGDVDVVRRAFPTVPSRLLHPGKW